MRNRRLQMKNFIIPFVLIVFFSGCGSNATTTFVRSIADYYDYSSVDWRELCAKYYRPNTADWSPEVDSLIINEFPMEYACEYWHILQNARTDFHQKSLSLRAEASEAVVDALDKAEAMFDTVFVKCVSQEYYLRLFPEMYNETMKPAIDRVVTEINRQ